MHTYADTCMLTYAWVAVCVCVSVCASPPLCMCLDSQVTQDAVTWKLNLNLSATFSPCPPCLPPTLSPLLLLCSLSVSPPALSPSLWPFIGEWLVPYWLFAESRSSNRLSSLCETGSSMIVDAAREWCKRIQTHIDKWTHIYAYTSNTLVGCCQW